MRTILTLAFLLMAGTAWAGPEFLALVGATGGTITLYADTTFTSTGPATITRVADPNSDGNYYFTIDFPAGANVSSVQVTAAGAAGGKWNTGVGGRGCIVTATVPFSYGNGGLIARIGVKPLDNTYTGGYGGGRGYDGSGGTGEAGGGGSTSLAYVSGNVILLEAGAGGGAAGGGTGADATGDGGGAQDASHGNQNGYWIAAGGGWTSSHTAPYPASSKIVSGSGSYATGASGNSGTGYMVITY